MPKETTICNIYDIQPAPASARNTLVKSWAGAKIEDQKLLRKLNQKGSLPKALKKAFDKQIFLINAAHNESDLYNIRSLGLHKLTGNRKEQYAIRLTGNWRLIVKFEEDADSEYLLILNIVDYH